MEEDEKNKSVEWKSPAEINGSSAVLEKIFSFILTRFEPASSKADADQMMTTDQIYKLITSHYKDDTIKPMNVYQLLEKANFIYDNKPGTLEFVWLLKRKKS